jgi:pimeloyl-ACP methyl ester carboxylesterase
VVLLSHDRHGAADDAPLVLVHGITESMHSWDPLVAALAETFDVLRVDLRGHGASPGGDGYDPLSLAGDVVETWTAAGFDTPTVVGHSLGGIVVTAAAVLAPTRSVVNVDQPLRLAAFKDGLAPLEPLLRGSRDEFDGALAAVFGSMHGPLPADEVARIGALRRAEPDVVLGIWGTVFSSTADELDATVTALAGGVTVPYLSLHGIDPGPEYHGWLTGLVPTAVVEVWPDHGHYPHLVDPARFLTRLSDWVASNGG